MSSTSSPKKPPADGLDDVDEVLVPDNCAASCVTCGLGPETNNWPLATSLSCLVGAGCVVLPDEDFDDVVKPDRVAAKPTASAAGAL
mmetsp:Transcript_23797/g.74361  ORF Transcript_23797/g.74361 Transcript_23797/m.74361 type:complete len:87 (+) Transcript_23797:214-474(+)